MPSRPSRPRAALTELAGRLPDTPLALVVAPAGAGKSVLLRAWRDALLAAGRTTALLELSGLHADAASFGAAWAESLERASPGSFPASLSAAARIHDPQRSWEALARALLRELSAEGPPLFSLLDGMESLPHGGPAAALVDEVVRASPRRLRLVIAGRSAALSAAARLRVEGSLLEIAADDLSLRADQVAAVLEAAGVPHDPALVAGVLAQTEGWATGVVLAARALAVAAPEDRRRTVLELARRKDLFAYFSEELLREEAPEHLAVLEAAALLGQATPDELCEVAEVPGGVALVRQVAARGLLLADDGDRLHAPTLWRGFFRRELAHRIGEQAAIAVRRRAAGVLARARRVDEAIDLVMEAGDFEAAAFLLARAGRILLGIGRRRLVLEWLGRLPPELEARRPELTMQHGMALLGSDPDRATALLERAARAFEAAGDAAGARTAWSALVFAHLTEGRMDAVRRVTRERMSLRRIFLDRSQRGVLLVGLAGRAQLARRFTRSLRLSEAAARHPLPLGARWLNATNRIVIHLLRGDFDRARALADESLGDTDLSHFPLPIQTLHVFRALATAAGGSPGEALGALAEAREAVAALRSVGLERTRMVASLALGQTAAAAGDPEATVSAYADAAALASRAGNRSFEAAALACLSSACLATGDEQRARSSALAASQVYEELLSEGGAVLPWLFARALWVRARTGEAGEAFDLATRHEARIARLDAPLAAHGTGLLLADIARLAGREKEAARWAREAWNVSAKAGLGRGDFELVREVELVTAPLVFGHGADVNHLIDRLQLGHPKQLAELLRTLLRDGNPAVRREAAEQMGRLGDRRFHAALDAAAKGDSDTRVRRVAAGALARLHLSPRHGLRLETLGRFRAFRDEEEISEREWRGVTPRRLLFRLLLANGRPVLRDTLLEDLWPGTEPDQARNHLRVATSRLHDVLEPERPAGVAAHFVRAEGEALLVPDDVRIAWDARIWEDALDAARRLPDAEGGKQRTRLFFGYGGPLLPDLGAETWLLPLRLRLAERWASLGHGLAGDALARGDLDGCEGLVARLLDHDESDEEAWALFMRVRLRRGERAGALRVFQQARECLERTMGAAPGAALQALAREARKDGVRDP